MKGSDQAILEILGHRLSRRRLERGLTQARLAAEAGVSKRTVERLESGGSTQVANLLRVLRALDLLGGLDRLVPETPVSPMLLLKQEQKRRKRARGSRGGPAADADPTPDQVREAAAPPWRPETPDSAGAGDTGWAWGDGT